MLKGVRQEITNVKRWVNLAILPNGPDVSVGWERIHSLCITPQSLPEHRQLMNMSPQMSIEMEQRFAHSVRTLGIQAQSPVMGGTRRYSGSRIRHC